MKNVLRNKVRAVLSSPDALLVYVYAALLLVGIWYAFPSLKVVGDEAPYVGGVLRAMQGMTLVPHVDYSYTVSFYANYALMVPFVGVLLLWFGSVASATVFLMEHIYLAYFVPRLVSVFAALALLVLFLALMRAQGKSFSERFALSSIVFCNIMLLVIAHTGKMWMLSLLLWFVAFFFFQKATQEHAVQHQVLHSGGLRSASFWSPVFAFLAFANFPVNVIAILFPVWLGVLVLTRGLPWRALAYGFVTGVLIFVGLFALNWDGWTTQNAITPVAGWHMAAIGRYFLYGALVLMPLLLAYLVFCTKRFVLSQGVAVLLLSLAGYMSIVALRAPWVGDSPESYWRYFVYIIFILGVLCAYLPSHRRALMYALAAIAIVFALRVDYLLAVPTTHVLARSYLVEHAGGELIVNSSPSLDLPKDRQSYVLTEDALCQSRCMYGRHAVNAGAGLRTIDTETKKGDYESLLATTPPYLSVGIVLEPSRALIRAFPNGLSSGDFKDVDYNLGPYTPGLFFMDRLGPAFFVYGNPDSRGL